MDTYSIGEAARQTGVKVPTIRYYESIGLLPKPPRADNNRRHFDKAAIGSLGFIRHARNLGFEIADIAVLLALREKPSTSCREADLIARSRLADIEDRIRQLEALRGELKDMIDGCHQQRVAECHIIEGLSERPCAGCA